MSNLELKSEIEKRETEMGYKIDIETEVYTWEVW